MTITSVDKDHDNLTITLIADFGSPIDRVWELWSDPRKLERWWGPPASGVRGGCSIDFYASDRVGLSALRHLSPSTGIGCLC